MVRMNYITRFRSLSSNVLILIGWGIWWLQFIVQKHIGSQDIFIALFNGASALVLFFALQNLIDEVRAKKLAGLGVIPILLGLCICGLFLISYTLGVIESGDLNDATIK